MLPHFCNTLVDVGLAGCNHLICDLDEERGHPLRCVVVGGDTVDHADGIHKTWDVFNHGLLMMTNKSMLNISFSGGLGGYLACKIV